MMNSTVDTTVMEILSEFQGELSFGAVLVGVVLTYPAFDNASPIDVPGDSDDVLNRVVDVP